MSGDEKEGEKKMVMPKGCRVNEKGEMFCSDESKREIRPQSQDGAVFKDTKVQFENMKCRKDKRDGKMHCNADFTADELPTA